MKETIKINLGGRLFDLDNDAFESLQSYLDSLKDYFDASADETEDILEGIEERMAELLEARLTSDKQVVTLDDVKYLIKIMGTAEQMDTKTDEGSDNNKSERKGKSYSRVSKRLYRDPENSILGGVCSGIAAYLDVDSLWVRLAFVALIFLNLIGLIVYLILWAVIPVARTASQRLEMRGKAVTIDNIEREVKKEFGKVKDNFRNFKDSESYRQTKNAVTEVFEVLAKILLIFVKIVGVIIIIALLIGLISLIIAMITGFAFHFPFNSIINRITHLPQMMFGFENSGLFSLAVFVLLAVPLIALVVGLFRLLTGSKAKNKVLGSFGATLWILALITVITLVLVDEKDFKFRQSSHIEYQMDYDNRKPLYLKVNEFEGDEIEHYQIFNKQYAYDGHSNRMLRKPKFVIKKTYDNEILLVINKEFSAFKERDDHLMGKRISDYDWNMEDSVLLLDEYFTVRKNYGWRMPSTEVVLLIPEGQELVFDWEFAQMLSYADIDSFYDYDELVGKRLVMHSDGLSVVK